MSLGAACAYDSLSYETASSDPPAVRGHFGSHHPRSHSCSSARLSLAVDFHSASIGQNRSSRLPAAVITHAATMTIMVDGQSSRSDLSAQSFYSRIESSTTSQPFRHPPGSAIDPLIKDPSCHDDFQGTGTASAPSLYCNSSGRRSESDTRQVRA